MTTQGESVKVTSSKAKARPSMRQGYDTLSKRNVTEWRNTSSGAANAVMLPVPFTARNGFSDDVLLSKIYTETSRYLSTLSRAAGDARAVTEANNFLRWLEFSGVLMLLEKYSSVDQKFLTLRKQADSLQDICKPVLQNRSVVLPPSLSRIDELNAKVDILLSQSAKPVPVSIT